MRHAAVLALLLAADAGGRPRGFDPFGAALAGELAGARAQIPRVAVSPNGRLVAAAAEELGVLVWSAADRKELRRINLGQYVRQLAFSGDSAHLIASAGRTLWVYRVSDWTVAWSTEDARATPEGFAAGPQGGRLAYCRLDRTRAVFDYLKGAELRTFAGRTGNSAATAWSPDGGRVAGSLDDLSVRIWEVETGRELLNLGPFDGEVLGVAFSPEGGRIAVCGGAGVVRIWDAVSGKAIAALAGHSETVQALAWSPEGRWIATAGVDGTVRLWEASRGREVRRLRGHAGLVGALAFLPEGRALLTAGTDGRVLLWGSRAPEPAAPGTPPRKAGYLGILGEDVPGGDGPVITEVLQGGAAERFRLAAGEAIVEFNGARVRTFALLAEQVRACAEGDDVRVRLRREGKEREVHVRLGARPEE